MALQINVDHTLPPAMFNAALKREASRVREERRLARMWEQIRARRIETAQKAFERMGWTTDAAREMAEIHVAGASA